MNLNDLKLNRFLIKTDSTNVSNSDVSSNTSVEDYSSNVYRKKNSNNSDANVANENDDAQNVLTGTVISSCFIRTSDRPSRVEISGNDMRLYDDSVGGTGSINGDSSGISFLRSDELPGGFVIRERKGKSSNLDNVMELFFNANTPGGHNFIFLGRDGIPTPGSINLDSMSIAIHQRTAEPAGTNNGYFAIQTYFDNDILTPTNNLFIVDSRQIGFAGPGTVGIIMGSGDGFGGIGYQALGTLNVNVGFYQDAVSLKMGMTILPDADNTYDIGSSSKKIKDLHVGGRLNVGKVTDAGPMTATNGTAGDIVFNISDTKFYGCTVTGSPATWAALN